MKTFAWKISIKFRAKQNYILNEYRFRKAETLQILHKTYECDKRGSKCLLSRAAELKHPDEPTF